MDLGLRKRSAVVLASTDGLGRAVARALSREGARVAISGRDEARLEAARSELAAGGGEVLAEPLDVTDGEALRRHLEAVHERFGTVNVRGTNAGGPPAATALEVDDAGLQASLELTLRSAVRAVNVCLPWMRAQGWGRIVGLTSLSVRQPIPNLVYSNVMRSGLTAYFKSLAGQVGRDGITVNTVLTGLFATDRLAELFELRARASGRTAEEERRLAAEALPVGRIGDPAELADLVAFLASERAAYLTGSALPIDGGAFPGLF